MAPGQQDAGATVSAGKIDAEASQAEGQDNEGHSSGDQTLNIKNRE